MAKVSDKKTSKSRPRKRSKVVRKGAAVDPDVVYDDGEKEADTTDEDEEDGARDDDERKRQKLVEAISSLGGKRKKTLGERSEAAVQMSEFLVNSKGESDKVDLSELIGAAASTAAVPKKTKKQLKSLEHNQRTTVECPLSKQESERIQRDLAFHKAATEVSRWDSVITQNRRAEQLVFPLHQEPTAGGPRPVEKVVTGWKARTPLETEVFALLRANMQPTVDPVLTADEEACVKAMSLEEAKIRRAELQKARALQSYYEAKARRESKIKSKKYRRVHNKSKRKELAERFEDMLKTDPAAALEELRKAELGRMRERMSLKHQNSGKWAKSKAIMAKYDEGARKAMQQQLEVNKDLTQKLVSSQSQEQEQEQEEEMRQEPEVLPDFVNDAEQGGQSANPWMRGKLSDEPAEAEAKAHQPVGHAERLAEDPEDEEGDDEEEVTEEEKLLREFDQRRRRRQHEAQDADAMAVLPVEDQTDDGQVEEGGAPAEDQGVSDGEVEEEEVLSEFKNIFQGIMEGHKGEPVAPTHASAPLNETLVRIQSTEDIQRLPQEDSAAGVTSPEAQQRQETPPAASQPQSKGRKRKKGIALKEVLLKGTKVLPVPLAPTNEDSEEPQDNLDQRGLIKEAFAGDDVVSDFLKEKKLQEDAGKPEDINLLLPGWGEWGGAALKSSRGKRRRFRLRAPAPPPRKDQHLPAVIISEKRNSSLSPHQVSALPFPFESHTQFESTVRSPLGRTWNTEQTVKKATKPRVVTRLGAIIEPMDKEELVRTEKPAPAAAAAAETATLQKHLSRH